MFISLEDSDEKFILLWWKLISIVSAFNLAVLIRYGLLLAPSKDSMTSHERWMRFLMVPYVVMTSLRSFWPAEYHNHVALFDCFMSSAFIGRLLATVGEICFATQIGMKLRQVSKDILAMRLTLFPRHDDTVSRLIRTITLISSFQVRSLCSIAQIFCIIHVAKGDSWFAGVEETLWGISFAFLGCCSIFLLLQYKYLMKHCKVQRQDWHFVKDQRRNEAFLWSLLVVSVSLAAYTLLYHCDILFQISIHENKHGRTFRPFLDGLRIAFSYKKVTRRFSDWKYTYDWQGIYFSFGSWFSMLMGLPSCIQDKWKRLKRAQSFDKFIKSYHSLVADGKMKGIRRAISHSRL